MIKFLYYLKIFLFTCYLLILFLLIDKLYKNDIFTIIYFLLNIIYSFITILTIISKKESFKKTISYNILNIGIYIYTFIIYFTIINENKFNILNNKIYFQNNFILISILLIGLIYYTLNLNKEKKKSD